MLKSARHAPSHERSGGRLGSVARPGRRMRRLPTVEAAGARSNLLGFARPEKADRFREVLAPSNKALKLTRLSAAPGLSLNNGTDGGAASCARGRVGGRTASQLNGGVRWTQRSEEHTS